MRLKVFKFLQGICSNYIFPTVHLEIEKWKWNDEYKVFVSSLGNFKNKDKTNIKPFINNKNGYMTLKCEGGQILVHRLVMRTWDPCENMENLTVDHLNHNKFDNSVKNLEWVSEFTNQDRAKNDLMQMQKSFSKLEKTQEREKSNFIYNIYKNNKIKYSCKSWDEVITFFIENTQAKHANKVSKKLVEILNTGIKLEGYNLMQEEYYV